MEQAAAHKKQTILVVDDDRHIKPLNPDYLLHSIRKAGTHRDLKDCERNYKQSLQEEVKKKTRELSDLNREIIRRLTVVAEYRDTDTGLHNSRIGSYAGTIAAALGLSSDFVETITLASSLHDIGKVAVPDSILWRATAGPCRNISMPGSFRRLKTPTTILRRSTNAIKPRHHCALLSGGPVAWHVLPTQLLRKTL